MCPARVSQGFVLSGGRGLRTLDFNERDCWYTLDGHMTDRAAQGSAGQLSFRVLGGKITDPDCRIPAS